MHAPTEHRPTTHDDMHSYYRDGQTVLHRPHNPTPAQAKWYGQALAAAVAAGLEVDRDMNVLRPLTAGELDSNLESMQRQYDTGREEYITFHTDGSMPKWNYNMQAYCKAEGLDLPTADEKDEA